jgi:hypothetical protein
MCAARGQSHKGLNQILSRLALCASQDVRHGRAAPARSKLYRRANLHIRLARSDSEGEYNRHVPRPCVVLSECPDPLCI